MPRFKKVTFCLLCVALFPTLGDLPRWHPVVRARAAGEGTPDALHESSITSKNGEADHSHSVVSNGKTDLLVHGSPGTSPPLFLYPKAIAKLLVELADNMRLDFSSVHVPEEIEQEPTRIRDHDTDEKAQKLLTEKAFSLSNSSAQAPKESTLIPSNEEGIYKPSPSSDKKGTSLGLKPSTTTSSSTSGTWVGLESLERLAERLEAWVQSISVPKEFEEKATRVVDSIVNELAEASSMKEVLTYISAALETPRNPSPEPMSEEKTFRSSTSANENASFPEASSSKTSSSSPSDAKYELERLEQLVSRIVEGVSSLPTPKEIQEEVMRIAKHSASELSVASLAKELLNWFSSFRSSIFSVDEADHPERMLSDASSSPLSDAADGAENLIKFSKRLEHEATALDLPKEAQREITRIAKPYVDELSVELLISEVLRWVHNHHPVSKRFDFPPAKEEGDTSSSLASSDEVGALIRKLSGTFSPSTSEESSELPSLEFLGDELEDDVFVQSASKDLDVEATPKAGQSVREEKDDVFMPSTSKDLDVEVTSKADQSVREEDMEGLIAKVLGWFGSVSTTPTPDFPPEQNSIPREDLRATRKELSVAANAPTAVTLNTDKGAVEQPLSAHAAMTSALHLGEEDAVHSGATPSQAHAQTESQAVSSSIIQSDQEEKELDGAKPTVDSSAFRSDGLRLAKNAALLAKTEEEAAQIQRLRASIRKINPLLDLEPPSTPRAFTNRSATGPATPFPHDPVSPFSLKTGMESQQAIKALPHKQPEAVMKAAEDGSFVLEKTLDSKAEPESVIRSIGHSTIGGLQPQTAGLLLLNQFAKTALQRLDPPSRQKLAAYLGTLPVEQQQNLLYYSALLQFIPEADATKLKQLIEHVRHMQRSDVSSAYLSVKTHPVEDTKTAVRTQQIVSQGQTTDPSFPSGGKPNEGISLINPGFSSTAHNSSNHNVRLPASSSSSSSTNISSSSSGSAGIHNSHSTYNSIYTSPTTSSSSSSNAHAPPYNSSSFNGVYTSLSDTSSTSYTTVNSRPISSSSSASKDTFTGPHISTSNGIPTTTTISNITRPTNSSNLEFKRLGGDLESDLLARNPYHHPALVKLLRPSTYTVNDSEDIAASNQAGYSFPTDPGRSELYPNELTKVLHPPFQRVNNGQGQQPPLPPRSHTLSGFHAGTNISQAPVAAWMPSSSSSNTNMLATMSASAGSSSISVPPVTVSMTRVEDSSNSNLQSAVPARQPHQQQATLPPLQMQQQNAVGPISQQQVPEAPQHQQGIATLPAQQHQQYIQVSSQPQRNPTYQPGNLHRQREPLPSSTYPQHYASPQPQQQYPLPHHQQQPYPSSWPFSSNQGIQQQHQLQQDSAQRPSRPVNYITQDKHIEQPYTYPSVLDTSHGQSSDVYRSIFTKPMQQARRSEDTSFYPSSNSPEDIRGAAGNQPFQMPQPLLPDLGDLSLRPILEPITTHPVIQPLVAPLQQLFGAVPSIGADAFRSVPVSGSNVATNSSPAQIGERLSTTSTLLPSIIPRETADTLLQPLAELIRLATHGVVTPTVTHANELLREAHEFNTRVHQGSVQATQFFNDFAAYRAANPNDPLVKLFATLEETAASLSTNKDDGIAVQERMSRQLQPSHSGGTKQTSSFTEEVVNGNKLEGGKRRGNSLRRRKASNIQTEKQEDPFLQGVQLGSVQAAVMHSEAAGHAGDAAATNNKLSAEQESLPAGNGSMMISEDGDLKNGSGFTNALTREESNISNAVFGEVKYKLTSKDDPFNLSSFASSSAAKNKNNESAGATARMIEQQEKKSQQDENIAGKVTNVIGATVDAALDLLARQHQRQTLRSQTN